MIRALVRIVIRAMQRSFSVFNSTSDDDSYAGASWPRRFSKPSLKPSPQGGRCRTKRGGRGGTAQGVISPNGTTRKATPLIWPRYAHPSSPKGGGCASRIKPSPQGGRCRTKRGGRGVLRRALLPRMGQHGKQRPSSGLAALTHLPPRGKVALRGLSLPLRGKVPNEERRKRGYCAGRYFPEWDNTESNAPHLASLRSPIFPKRGRLRFED